MKIDKVKNAIDKYNMLPKGGKVLVALSGGSDSMCLLYSLISLKELYNITIEAAHINHCIRGNEADSDENFCSQQCELLGVKLHILKADVIGISQTEKISVEEAGRRVRYEFFSSLNCDYIATAHNLSDRIETMLFNFTRGSSLKGLCSIPPIRNNIIRPLIDCTKAEINEFCEQNNIPYVTDKTNFDTKYTRNKIRHNVIKELKDINPSFEFCAQRCIEDINLDEQYLFSLAENLYNESNLDEKYSINSLAHKPLPILKRAIAIIIEANTNLSADSRMIDEIISSINDYADTSIGRKIQLSGNIFARTRADMLEIYNDKTFEYKDLELKVGENIFGDYTINLEIIPKCKNLVANSNEYYIDFNKVVGNLIARQRLPEDKISLKSRGISKSLRKLQNEIKIPPELRDSLPVISDDNGLILAYKCGIDSRVLVSDNTNRVLKISIFDNMG